MKGIDLYNITVFATPVCAAVSMLIMLGYDILNADGDNCRPQKWLFVFFMVMALHELLPVFHYYSPEKFLYMNWLFCLVLYLAPVLYYRFVFEITAIRTGEHFPWQHYVFPVAASLLTIVLTCTVPCEEQYRILACRGKYTVGHTLFEQVSCLRIPVKLLVESFYLVVSLIRIGRYRKHVVNYVSNEKRSSLRWVYRYPLFIVIMTAMSICAVLMTRDTFYSLPPVTGLLFILAFIEVNIAYHTIRGDYVLPEAKPEVPAFGNGNEADNRRQLPQPKKTRLTRVYFEEYIHTRKPYLNPDLKITDLIDDLEMNRTYISGFINREYDMNFSRYINSCRLKEYRRLLADPAMKDRKKEELSELAGFSNYKYFLRLSGESRTSKGAIPKP